MYVWEGKCLKCDTWFRHPDNTEENPSPSGTFCPECRAKGYFLVGVIQWNSYIVEEVFCQRDYDEMLEKVLNA